MEDTLVILKPDGVEKRLLSSIVARFAREGLIVSNLKVEKLNKEILREHYQHLINRDFFPELEEFMSSLPVVIMIVSGENAVLRVRDIVGATDPNKALPNTIRGQYGDKKVMMKNVVHASDSIENSLIEIKRFYHFENVLIDKNNLFYCDSNISLNNKSYQKII